MTRALLIVLAALALLSAGCASMGSGGSAASLADARRAFLEQRYGEALPLLQSAARDGDARAQYAIGYMFYNGYGVEEDLDRAMTWIRRAANAGDPLAVEALGRIAQGLSRPEVMPGQSAGDSRP